MTASTHHRNVRSLRLLLALLVVVMPSLAACGKNETATDGKVTLLFSTSAPSASYFPFYVADAKGMYEDHGLEVEFSYSTGSSSAVQQLASANVDYAIVTPDSIFTTASQDIDLVYVYEHFYENRFGVVVPEGSPVQSMVDLKGESIGVSEAAGGEVPTVRAAISSAGLTEGGDVDVISVGEGSSALKALEKGKVAALGVAKPDIVSLQNTGAKLRYITPDELTSLPGDGLAVRPESLSGEAADQLADLIAATRDAWSWSTSNPDEAYQIVKEGYAQEQLADDDYGKPFFEINLNDTTPPSGMPQGKVDVQGLDGYMTLLADLDLLDEPVDIEEATSNKAFDIATSEPGTNERDTTR